jgi:hypothetical protein
MLPNAIDIAESVMPELVADGVNTSSLESIDIFVLQQRRVKLEVSGGIEGLK